MTLHPHLAKRIDIGLIDWGQLPVGPSLDLLATIFRGFRRPRGGKFRVWHARRDIDMIIGIILRDILRQRWRLVFTSAANRQPGPVLGWLISRMDVVIAASRYSAGFLEWHTEVIGHGVDVDMFVPAVARAKATAASGMPGQYLIGCFGRIRASKGTDLFVDAMISLLPGFADFSAVIAGCSRPRDAEFEAMLRRRIEAANLSERIRFVGQLDLAQTRQWMGRLSLCVAPSRQEGFGLTVMEAFASGAPAVAARVGVWPALIDASSGRLFDTGDLDDLLAVLGPLLSEPEQLVQMGQSARDKIVRNHTAQHEAAALCQLYQTLIDGQLPGRQRSDASAPDDRCASQP